MAVLIITVCSSLALAAAPIVMEDHFQIKEIENVEIRAEVGDEIRLPKKLEAEFKNGIKAEFPVDWELKEKLSFQEKGNYQLEGKIIVKDYPNPLVEQRADPFIYKHQDGYYYFTASYPEYDRIIIRRAETITGLKEAEEKVIWWKHEDQEMSKHIWAQKIYGDSNLYLAELKTPWEIEGEQKLIAEPVHSWDQNDNPVFGIPGYEIKGNKDAAAKIIIE